MQFTSLDFAFFFLVVIVVYWLLPRGNGRTCWLLGASVLFYATWSVPLTFLVCGTALLNFGVGIGLEVLGKEFGDSGETGGANGGGGANPLARRFLMVSCVVLNLCILCYFKYANFFLDSLRAFLETAGGSPQIPVLDIIVPFGISFYIFEVVSYTMDVYRRRIRAERNPVAFLLFILFFPHLVAGPIVRAGDFLPQVKRSRRFSLMRVGLGARLFILGLFKKLAISDNMAFFSDPIFDHPEMYRGSALALGLLAFAIRIWADFSGYSDMAIGCAHLLGFRLTNNFCLPYLSLNISEFWRRWHISLSSWFRDYLFVPLGGSRGSFVITARNLLVTMSLAGLWHGANWSYVLWGVVHGVMLILHRGFAILLGGYPRMVWVLDTVPGKVARWSLTFFVVVLSWSLFQPDLARSTTLLQRLFFWAQGESLPVTRFYLLATIGLLVLGHLCADKGWFVKIGKRIPAPLEGCIFALVLLSALVLAPSNNRVFIYFQF